MTQYTSGLIGLKGYVYTTLAHGRGITDEKEKLSGTVIG
jgi:hypothetical protein